MIKVLIADDHEIVRQGLMYILGKNYPGATFGQAAAATDLLQLVREQRWDVILLDINMPGRSGLEALKDLHLSHPHVPVLILSSHPEDQYALRMLEAGASGYMTKESALHELTTALQCVLGGGIYVSRALTEQLALTGQRRKRPSQAPHHVLSDREYQVLLRLSAGQTVAQIAQELGLSVQSISTYRGRILNKMKMNSTADLVRYTVENKLS